MSDLPTGGQPGDPDDAPSQPQDDTELDTEIIEDDEPVDEPAEPDGAELEPSAQPAPSQGRARGRPNGQVIRDLQSQNADLSRRLDEMLARQNAPRAPTPAEQAEAQRLERERYEMMTPYEQAQYLSRQIREQVQREIAAATQPIHENTDVREYEGLISQNANYRRFDAEVANLRRQYPGLSRVQALKYAIGDAAIRGAPAATTRARNAAAATAARQTARPSQARGDIAPDNGRRGNTVADRLRGVQI